MIERRGKKLTLLTIVAVPLLPVFLALAFLFGSARPALAEIPSTFKIPHEVQRSGMLVLDLNGDGKKEMIFGSIDGFVTVVNGASYQVAWDKNMADYLDGYSKTRLQSSLAAADLNGDGNVEIVVATGGADPVDGDGPGALIVLTYVGGRDYFEMMSGWPVLAFDALGPSNRPDGHPDGYTSTPSLGDIDGDGDLEIVIGGMDRRIHAFHHDGTYVLGWPLDRARGMLRESRSTASLADLDGDGKLDIIIGSNNYGIPSCANPYHFYAFKGDSTLMSGFPYSTTQNIESSPAVGDIDGDGSLDIIFGTGDFNENCGQPSDGKKVYALNRRGQLLTGWPVTTNANMVNSPALGDLDNDGTPEVVIHTQNTLYAWHGDGSNVQGFPVTNNNGFNLRHASPVLADIDGDSQVEIILASGQVYGPTGQLEQERNKLQSQVVVVDQDDDGLLETIGANHFNYNIGLHLMVYMFHETGAATGAQPWPMFHRSLDRNGFLPILYTLSGRIVNETNRGVAGVEVTLNTGQTALTDRNGNYTFGSLSPAEYTVTPSYQNNIFKPEQRTINLTANATLEAMVMHAPVYDIAGRVLHANGSGMAGVTVQLNTGASQTTKANGAFSFNDQQPGQYTLTPMLPDLNYLPSEVKLTAQDELLHIFYALPKPVNGALVPDGVTQIEFADTQGLPTRVTFPEGLGEEQAIITPVLPNEPNGYLSTGHALEISLVGAATHSEMVAGDGTPLSVEIEIQYSTADLRSLLDAEELVLMWESPDGWTDAQASCATPAEVEHNLATKTITVPVCQWGTYGLFAPIDQLYMPVLMSDE